MVLNMISILCNILIFFSLQKWKENKTWNKIAFSNKLLFLSLMFYFFSLKRFSQNFYVSENLTNPSLVKLQLYQMFMGQSFYFCNNMNHSFSLYYKKRLLSDFTYGIIFICFRSNRTIANLGIRISLKSYFENLLMAQYK